MAFCDVSGTIINGGGTAISEAPVRAHLNEGDNPKFDSDGNLVSDQTVSSKSDANGDFTIRLTQGLSFVIDIEDANYHKKVTIPMQATANLEDL